MSSDVQDLRLLTVKELASATGIAAWRIHAMVAGGGGPPHLRIGRTYRFPVRGVREWIEQQTKCKGS